MGKLCVCRDNVVRPADFDAVTGEVIYQDEKLEGINGIYASPIVANDVLYIATQTHLYAIGK